MREEGSIQCDNTVRWDFFKRSLYILIINCAVASFIQIFTKLYFQFYAKSTNPRNDNWLYICIAHISWLINVWPNSSLKPKFSIQNVFFFFCKLSECISSALSFFTNIFFHRSNGKTKDFSFFLFDFFYAKFLIFNLSPIFLISYKVVYWFNAYCRIYLLFVRFSNVTVTKFHIPRW